MVKYSLFTSICQQMEFGETKRSLEKEEINSNSVDSEIKDRTVKELAL